MSQRGAGWSRMEPHGAHSSSQIALLEDDAPRTGNCFHCVYKRLSIRLDYLARDGSSCRLNHRNRAACAVGIDSDIPVHVRPPFWGQCCFCDKHCPRFGENAHIIRSKGLWDSAKMLRLERKDDINTLCLCTARKAENEVFRQTDQALDQGYMMFGETVKRCFVCPTFTMTIEWCP